MYLVEKRPEVIKQLQLWIKDYESDEAGQGRNASARTRMREEATNNNALCSIYVHNIIYKKDTPTTVLYTQETVGEAKCLKPSCFFCVCELGSRRSIYTHEKLHKPTKKTNDCTTYVHFLRLPQNFFFSC
eukprot:scaffold8048_cov155-Amphora_coffeaeformis.AAC.4